MKSFYNGSCRLPANSLVLVDGVVTVLPGYDGDQSACTVVHLACACRLHIIIVVGAVSIIE